MALWLIDWVVVVFPSLRFCRHVLDIEHLIHILGKDERFVFVPNIVEVHGCHSILVVDATPPLVVFTHWHLNTGTLKVGA